MVEKSCLKAGQKDLRGEAREKSTSGGVLRWYVEATPLGARMIPAAIEHNYPKRLLTAGWWHMSLFQQHASGAYGIIVLLRDGCSYEKGPSPGYA